MLDPDAENDLIMELNIICARMEYGEPIEDAAAGFSVAVHLWKISRTLPKHVSDIYNRW